MLPDDLVEGEHERFEPVVTLHRELPVSEVSLPEERMRAFSVADTRLQHLVQAGGLAGRTEERASPLVAVPMSRTERSPASGSTVEIDTSASRAPVRTR